MRRAVALACVLALGRAGRAGASEPATTAAAPTDSSAVPPSDSSAAPPPATTTDPTAVPLFEESTPTVRPGVVPFHIAVVGKRRPTMGVFALLPGNQDTFVCESPCDRPIPEDTYRIRGKDEAPITSSRPFVLRDRKSTRLNSSH